MKIFVGYFFVIILSFWSIRPFLGNGYFPMHDDTQVARIIVMGRALKDGQFPVRWVSDLGYGYGYPLFNFYGPLPYYAGGVLYAAGIDSVSATKAMFAAGILLSALSMYALLLPFCGFLGALTGSMLFLYAPYHAAQIYVRGSVGEYWAVAFIPLILLGVYRKKPIIGAFGLAGAIASHVILGYLTTVILGFSAALLYLRNRDMNALKIIVLGLGLSAFFWLPAWRELPFTSVSKMITGAPTTFFDHFVCPGQLWNSPWGFAGSAPGCIDGMSFKLGKAQIAAFIMALILMARPWKRFKIQAIPIAQIGAVIAMVSLFLTLGFSEAVWRIFPFTDFIQYPWRMLSFTVVGMAVSGAYAVGVWRIPLVRIVLAVIFIWGTLSLGVKIFQPQYTYSRESRAFETPEELRFAKSKISDEYLPEDIPRPVKQTDFPEGPISESDMIRAQLMEKSSTHFRIDVASDNEQQVLVYSTYFPGWKYFVNGKAVDPGIVRGFPSVVVYEGTSRIEGRFTDTPVRTVANAISVITFIIVIIFIFPYGKKAKT